MSFQRGAPYSIVADSAPPDMQPMVKRSYEGSPAYTVLRNMLEDKYRKHSAVDLDLIPANSTVCANLTSITCCDTFAKQFVVTDGCLRAGEDGAGKYLFFGPGVHKYNNMFGSVARYDTPLTTPIISNGNRSIVTIKQGYIGYAEDMGQPVLLPPGLHEWESSTLVFIEAIDLNNTMIHLGPYTLLTVDEGIVSIHVRIHAYSTDVLERVQTQTSSHSPVPLHARFLSLLGLSFVLMRQPAGPNLTNPRRHCTGYAAITQNNGEQIVLPGGKTHLLTHRNHKFEKFMSGEFNDSPYDSPATPRYAPWAVGVYRRPYGGVQRVYRGCTAAGVQRVFRGPGLPQLVLRL
eukprot:1191147-Prorocentrum_minimum.AAC.2